MVKMGFVKVASTREVGTNKMKSFDAGGKPILIVNLKGEYYAIGDVCTHMGCKLSDGVIEGENVKCPCHGSVFDVKSGKVLNQPAKKPEPAFKVKVEGDQILVRV